MSLPDEIISEILCPALKVSDEVFSDISEKSPFAVISESSSAYLVVCKAWLRVGTPLLYNVVILRSTAQAKALGQALSKNKVLGQFIKKLRVEGGYGASMRTILQCSPNISDLFLSFQIWATENTAGLCKGLQLVNPTHIILQDAMFESQQTTNKMVSTLVDAVVAAIPKWDRLSSFECNYDTFSESARATKFIPPLLQAPKLHTVVVPSIFAAKEVYLNLKASPLRRIKIKKSVPAWARKYLPGDNEAAFKALLEFHLAPVQHSDQAIPDITPDIAPSLNPAFKPMVDAATDTQDAVWARVLYFAMSVPQLAVTPDQKNIPPRLPLLLMSKTFHRLGIPHYYAHVTLKTATARARFLLILLRNTSLGPQVRSICGNMKSVNPWDTSGWSSEEDSEDSDSENLRAVAEDPMMVSLLSQTTGLLRMCGWSADNLQEKSCLVSRETMIPWDAFEALAKSSGSTLREFSHRVGLQQRASTVVFNDLTQLQSLDWKCEAQFACSTDGAPLDGLPNLEELRVWRCDPSFLTALSLMKLFSLRRLSLSLEVEAPIHFLQTHGFRLVELDIPYRTVETLKVNTIFDVCPSLRFISLAFYTAFDKPPVACYFSQPAPALEKIRFDAMHWHKSSRKEATAGWEAFFADLALAPLPGLREIQVKCCQWPTTQRDIVKSCWVRWAENLLKHSINLTDRNGIKWRPRLKIK
ncbi:hypothetical protein C8R43DRAFT_1016426 [Mycena crocata]|nr:hypothetical protein C8R43DRAFT_1016426 [Mycena crocata]